MFISKVLSTYMYVRVIYKIYANYFRDQQGYNRNNKYRNLESLVARHLVSSAVVFWDVTHAQNIPKTTQYSTLQG